MKRLIICLLSVMMLISFYGCKADEPVEEDPKEKVDYRQYQVNRPEKPEALLYPIEADYYVDGKLDNEALTIAYAEFAGRNQDREINKEFNRALGNFNLKMIQTLLNDRENNVFSPVNLYQLFAALSSVSKGKGHDELIDLLGISEESLTDDYKGQYQDNRVTGEFNVAFGGSIWLNDKYSFKRETINELGEDFYMTAFKGDMGSKDYSEALKSWLNDNTGNLLEKDAAELEMDEGTAMALASSLYYKSSWCFEYDPDDNTKEVFHGINGDGEVTMMHKSVSRIYEEYSDFTVCLDFCDDSNNYMLLVLPKKGYSLEKLFEDEEFTQLITDQNYMEMPFCRVKLSMPKFDVSSNLKLHELLPEAGLKAVFSDPESFSSLVEGGVVISTIEHACRLSTDEKGIEGAAYTLMELKGEDASSKVREFILDRPFFFLVGGYDNTAFFAGTVNMIP